MQATYTIDTRSELEPGATVKVGEGCLATKRTGKSTFSVVIDRDTHPTAKDETASEALKKCVKKTLSLYGEHI